MKQEEKNRRSREIILASAFAEFGQQGYLGASVNTICARGHISKGLLYHYYADKDALYMACVEKCFQELTAFLSAHIEAETVTPDQYFETRLAFFRENPLHQSIFCDTVVNRPPHLSGRISACRAPFDVLNERVLTAILEKETLEGGTSIRDALWLLRMFEDFVSVCLKNTERENRGAEYDRLCRQTLHTMLYGLIARP